MTFDTKVLDTAFDPAADLAAFTKANQTQIRNLFERIPGQKHLIKGNHDNKRVLGMGWASVADMRTVKDEGQNFFLCHYPMLTWPASRYNCLHLFGHVHNNWNGSRNSVNAGVDVWDFMPVRFEDITRRAKMLPVNKHWADVEHNAKDLG